MGLKALGAIFESGLYARGARGAVLRALANFINDDSDLAWPSYEALGFAGGVARETAIREIRALVDLGIVEKVSAGSGQSTNRYRLNMDILHAGAALVRAAKKGAGFDPKARHEAANAARNACEKMIEKGDTAGLMSAFSGDLSSPLGNSSGDTDAASGDPDGVCGDVSSPEPLKNPYNNSYRHITDDAPSGASKSFDQEARNSTDGVLDEKNDHKNAGDAPSGASKPFQKDHRKSTVSTDDEKRRQTAGVRIGIQWIVTGELTRLEALPFAIDDYEVRGEAARRFILTLPVQSLNRIASFITWAEQLEAGTADATPPLREVARLQSLRADAISGDYVKARCAIITHDREARRLETEKETAAA